MESMKKGQSVDSQYIPEYSSRERGQILGKILEKVQGIDEIRRMLERANLDNSTTQLESTPFRSNERKGTEMAEQRRKVRTSYNDDGSPKYIWLRAKNDDEMNDKIVMAYVKSGRIKEFLPKDALTETPHDKMLFKPYVESWMQTYKVQKLKPTTLSGYKSYLNQHLYPAFENKALEDIKTADIQNFLNVRKHLANKTLRQLLVFLREIFADAIEDKLLSKNPAISRKIVIPSDKVTERQALSLEQMKSILSNLSKLQEDDKLLLVLLLHTGCRRGEVLGLRWEDVDTENGLIHIQRNVTFSKNQPRIGSPKTEKGKRVIPLDAQLLAFIQPIKESGFIVGGGETPLTQMAYKWMWQRISKTINLYGATAHVLRHTYLTLLAGTNVDIKTLQTIAGHANSQITLDRYTHPQTRNILDAGMRMNQLLTT